MPSLRAELRYERDELTIARTECKGLRRELMAALQVGLPSTHAMNVRVVQVAYLISKGLPQSACDHQRLIYVLWIILVHLQGKEHVA